LGGMEAAGDASARAARPPSVEREQLVGKIAAHLAAAAAERRAEAARDLEQLARLGEAAAVVAAVVPYARHLRREARAAAAQLLGQLAAAGHAGAADAVFFVGV
ncbi:unnamed protein product, partial [Prorocentrum cordatum]